MVRGKHFGSLGEVADLLCFSLAPCVPQSHNSYYQRGSVMFFACPMCSRDTQFDEGHRITSADASTDPSLAECKRVCRRCSCSSPFARSGFGVVMCLSDGGMHVVYIQHHLAHGHLPNRAQPRSSSRHHHTAASPFIATHHVQ